MWDSGSRLGAGLEALLSRYCDINKSHVPLFYVSFPSASRSENIKTCTSQKTLNPLKVIWDLTFCSSAIIALACKGKQLSCTNFKRLNETFPRVLQASSSSPMHAVFVRNWSIANQSGSLLIQREPNCVKLIKSDRCVCFHSWLRCSAEPLSLYFIKILPKSIKGSVFYTLTLSLIKLALIILADVWSPAKKTRTIPGYMSWTLWSSSPYPERLSLKVKILNTCL